MAQELVDFLNNVVANNPAGDILPDNETIPISASQYPVLGNIFKQVSITSSNTGCNFSLGLVETSGAIFHLTFTYINNSGDCSTVTCYCVAANATGLHFEVYPSNCGMISTSNNGSIITTLDCLKNVVTSYYTKIRDVINSTSVTFRDFNNHDQQPVLTDANLYATGKLGIWKPFVNYYYKDERVNQRLSGSVKLDHDGVYKGKNANPLINEFYLFSWKPTLKYPAADNWTYAGSVSQFDKHHNTVETRDIKNIYSGTQYAYNGQLPVIKAGNARKNELFFESFEESASELYTNLPSSTLSVSNVAHSGKKSLYVTTGGIELQKFKPLAYGTYVISLWTSKNAQPVTYAGTSEDMGIIVIGYNAAGTPVYASDLIRPSGNVIDKWQQITGVFSTPGNIVKIAIQFKVAPDGNPGAAVPAYFDDIRIIPFNATASTSVYDPYTFRLVSTLDDDHFATYYNYNEEGKLFMMKKETEAGVKTISETRTHIKE